MRRFLPILTLGLAVLLASPVLADPAPSAPRGPGKLFPTVEAAAMDGLAYAYEKSLASGKQRISRGGTILRVEKGYTYGPLISATASAPDELRFRLGKSAVAHFHTYPTQSRAMDRRNETHSPADRAVVDRYDSKHRPSFVLTPSLRVVAYHGEQSEQSGDVFVASLAQPTEQQMLAGR